MPNSNVTFQCNASGIPKPVISWRKEGGDIPRRHSIAHGVLKMTSLVGEDDGRYICTASNTAGASAINVGLTVEGMLHEPSGLGLLFVLMLNCSIQVCYFFSFFFP